MRIAVFSDIHGNCVALDAVLSDLHHHPADRLVCLGDVIQGGPQPAETVARLREVGCPIVMGNADAWLLSGQTANSTEPVTERQQAVRAWSLTRLTQADQAFISGFQPTIALELGAGKSFLCFHGSPSSFDDIILPDTPYEEVARLLTPPGADFLAGGHTHLQQIRRMGAGFFFNPGSVGLAYSHQQPEVAFRADPWAEYAVLTVAGTEISLEFRRVPFDVETLILSYQTSGRPDVEAAVAQYQWIA
jgi:putative phosphoesterase